LVLHLHSSLSTHDTSTSSTLSFSFLSAVLGRSVASSIIHIVVFWVMNPVVWYVATGVSVENTASIFRVGGVSMFLQNTGNPIPE
jgi:hypothetical protein